MMKVEAARTELWLKAPVHQGKCSPVVMSVWDCSNRSPEPAGSRRRSPEGKPPETAERAEKSENGMPCPLPPGPKAGDRKRLENQGSGGGKKDGEKTQLYSEMELTNPNSGIIIPL